MDKYTRTLMAVIRIPIGIFCILIGLALLGVSAWVSTFSDVASMILLMALLAGGALINYGVGYAFLGDEYKATGIVRNGNTTYAPALSTRFLKRRKAVTFIGFVSYILLSCYYAARAILSGIYIDYLDEIGFSTSIATLIVCAAVSLVVAFCLFLLHKRTKHIDLNE
jgi:hypothetical protein